MPVNVSFFACPTVVLRYWEQSVTCPLVQAATESGQNSAKYALQLKCDLQELIQFELMWHSYLFWSWHGCRGTETDTNTSSTQPLLQTQADKWMDTHLFHIFNPYTHNYSNLEMKSVQIWPDICILLVGTCARQDRLQDEVWKHTLLMSQCHGSQPGLDCSMSTLPLWQTLSNNPILVLSHTVSTC